LDLVEAAGLESSRDNLDILVAGEDTAMVSLRDVDSLDWRMASSVMLRSSQN